MSELHHQQPSVSALIVNYKSGPYAVECIHSLLKQKYAPLQIIVVDNASGDGSVNLLRSTFGNVITLIESPDNLGFGQANNLAASHANGDYLLLVNPDACLLDQEFISTLISFVEKQPDIGIAGPEIHEPGKRKYVLPKKKYPSEGRLGNKNSLEQLPGSYAWILGACMCIKRNLFIQIGGFDPEFFLYGEDTDICLRVRKAGYRVGYCKEAKLTHVGGASESTAIPLDKYLRKKRGFFLFCRKHYDPSDVKRIAHMSLVSTYFASLKIAIRKLLGAGDACELQNRMQRIEATRIVIRETLEHYKKMQA